MARENFALLYGHVTDAPKIHINDQGERVQGSFRLKVIRRSTGSNYGGTAYLDFPLICSRNEEMIRQIEKIREGDMILVRGVFVSQELNRRTICPVCGNISVTPCNRFFIHPIFICRQASEVDDETALRMLRENAEISNIVNFIGKLCRDPQWKITPKGKYIVQYQLAANRRYHIHEDPDEIRTDYPWVKSFGAQAKKDIEALHVGSEVYIAGALQARTFSLSAVCKECGAEYSWQNGTMEIVPYYVGYLENCLIPSATETEVDGFES